jgi:hypothetical protein
MRNLSKKMCSKHKNFIFLEKDLWWISLSNICSTLQICALRPTFLNNFTLIWHHVFAPCAQLSTFSPRFWVRTTLYAVRPTFMKSTLDQKPKLALY